jgi:hypothetical protein
MHHRWTAGELHPFRANAGRAVEVAREAEKLSMRLLGMILLTREWKGQETLSRSVERRSVDLGISDVGPNKECLLQRSEAHFVRGSPRSNTLRHNTWWEIFGGTDNSQSITNPFPDNVLFARFLETH